MSLNDSATTISQLKTIMQEFVAERDWTQFHSPKNLSMALSIEASELMEHFQWITIDSSREIEPEKLVQVGEELADVFSYTLAMANSLGLDLTKVFERKMELNRQKYPSQQYKGRYGTDDPNPVSE